MLIERLTLIVWDHYRLATPQLYKQMGRDGTLWETVSEKVEACRQQIDVLIQQGMGDEEATALCVETEIRGQG